MHFRVFLLGWALLAVTACDRGVSLYDKAVETEKAGQTDDARWQYLSIINRHAKSEKFADAKRAFVRLSMDACETALTAGDPSTCAARLKEAEPHLEDEADKTRFKKVSTAERNARILADQSEAIRQFAGRVAALATEEARAKPNIEQQAAFKWDEFVVPNLSPGSRALLHLGTIGGLQRREFDFGAIKRLGEGQYVLEVVTATQAVAEPAEWFMQATTSGWRIVCAQKAGAADCKDPWRYSTLRGE